MTGKLKFNLLRSHKNIFPSIVIFGVTYLLKYDFCKEILGVKRGIIKPVNDKLFLNSSIFK